MRVAQLIHVTVALAVTIAAGCNRADTREQTQQAADNVKAAATRATDKISDELADGWMTTRIQSQFFADDQVKARYLDVTSNQGIVTLKGFVETPAAHERAVQIARSTSGVREVNDQILIGRSPKDLEAGSRPVATTGAAPVVSPATVDDEQLRSMVQAAFFLDPAIKGRSIDVDARGGVVTLKGEVASESERAQALVLARNAKGVQRVEDNLTVDAALEQSRTSGLPGAPPDDAALAATVKSKLDADARLTAITVTVKDGVLSLQGNVATAAAHQRALAAASETEGIRQVVDRMTVGRK